jgi:hypothetical protein
MSNSTTSRSSTADDLDGALRSLETMVDTMKEFVILIGGCERVCRNPYDTYLYIDNFMFGRHICGKAASYQHTAAEKSQ